LDEEKKSQDKTELSTLTPNNTAVSNNNKNRDKLKKKKKK
jgi:hypothetical protein